MFVAVISLAGCGIKINHQQSLPNKAGTSLSAIVLDGVGDPMCDLSEGDPSCNAQGPGQRLAVDADGCCRLYIADDTCSATEDSIEFVCPYTSCGADLECDNASDDPDNLTATCLYTQTAFAPEGFGVCFYAWADCEVLPGTPCNAQGVVFCEDGECECNAVANMDAATGELCDGVDNDCDGAVDNGFAVGDACDSDDTDLCESGALVCSADGLSTECSGDANIVESCDGLDDDCDGEMDEDFDTLGLNCDTDDADQCSSGTLVCSADGLAVECSGDDNVVESCNGEDDDCDDAVDEGCDDDNDGWCDSAMLFGVGAECQVGDCDDDNATVNPGVEEQCLTAGDDNCDGDTEFLLDGVTQACDSCANALVLPCGEEVVLDMATEPNGANAIESYQCNSRIGPVQINKVFAGREVVVIPDADPGTEFSLQIVSQGTGAYAFRLNGSCEPAGGSAVTAQSTGGTCGAYSRAAVGGGVVGEDFVALDALSDQVVTVRFTCVAPD